MSAPAPEAENEYSKGAPRPPARSQRGFTRPGRGSWTIAALGLLGAALLLVAEFTPLYSVHVSSYGARSGSVSAGSHNAYALIPIAALAVLLALTGVRREQPATRWALIALGVIALGIALLGDLPDTRARGITHGLAFASTSAAAGLYLETLGAVLLLAAGGLGLLGRLRAGRTPRAPERRQPPSRRRGPQLDGRTGGESAS